MAWRDLFTRRTSGIDDAYRRLREMLDINRHTLTLGVSGLLGVTDRTALPHRSRRSDDRVDELARHVRGQLAVHAAVRGAHTDTVAMLAAMSIVKDIQQIGDHAVGLVRLACIHGHFTPHQPEHVALAGYRTRLDAHLDTARDVLRTHDATVASEQIPRTLALANEIDLAIDLLIVTGHDPTHATATVLIYRHLSRIAAHLTNVATSVALPLEQLDRYDGHDNHHALHATAPASTRPPIAPL